MKKLVYKIDKGWYCFTYGVEGSSISIESIEEVIIARKRYKIIWKKLLKPYDDHGKEYLSSYVEGFITEPTFNTKVSLTDIMKNRYKVYVDLR